MEEMIEQVKECTQKRKRNARKYKYTYWVKLEAGRENKGDTMVKRHNKKCD